MSVVSFPGGCALQIGGWALAQQRFDITEQSDSTGHTAARLGAPPRWRLNLRSVSALVASDAARWKATALQLRGRINHLAMWDVTNPQPRGTARGAITLDSTAAAGATSIALAGLRQPPNLLASPSFETDQNSNGIADGWVAYAAGTTGTVTRSLQTGGFDKTYLQRIIAAGLGSTSSDRAGITQTDIVCTSGLAYTLSVYYKGTVGCMASLYTEYLDGIGATVGFTALSSIVLSASWVRYQLTTTAPAGAVKAKVYLLCHSMPGGPAPAQIEIDAAQFEQAAAATAFATVAPTLLQGDWLQLGAGVGSHYCMVLADATATDAGLLTAAIEPPTRASISAGTAAIWDKPLAHYKLVPDSIGWDGVPGSNDVGGFAFDLIEDWRA